MCVCLCLCMCACLSVYLSLWLQRRGSTSVTCVLMQPSAGQTSISTWPSTLSSWSTRTPSRSSAPSQLTLPSAATAPTTTGSPHTHTHTHSMESMVKLLDVYWQLSQTQWWHLKLIKTNQEKKPAHSPAKTLFVTLLIYSLLERYYQNWPRQQSDS